MHISAGGLASGSRQRTMSLVSDGVLSCHGSSLVPLAICSSFDVLVQAVQHHFPTAAEDADALGPEFDRLRCQGAVDNGHARTAPLSSKADLDVGRIIDRAREPV